MGLDDFLNSGGPAVDGWIKIGESGISFGNNLTRFSGLRFRLQVAEIRYFQVVSFGNPAQYLKTADGVTCVEGGSWEQALARAGGKRPYESAELVFELLEDAVDPKSKQVIAASGTRWGYSTPYNASQKFKKLLSEIHALGIDPRTADVELKLDGEPKARNGNQWKEIVFELVGPYAVTIN
ncbi:hypothetical protein P409_00150 [Inquilinus limosus MP06]|uniref:Uncharacterized protein n=2 Tax=Inquilinus limosus TaxID=171674 RepID=A0A0A0DGH8_9PROT|nr:hypothetical protein P409_00150 [Inquilinus limosus MP06]